MNLHLLNGIRRNVSEREHDVTTKHTPNYRQSIGGRIKEKRVDLGLTQAELARQINRSRSNVAQYERNDSVPPMAVAHDMAKALKAPVTYFFDGTLGPMSMPSPDELGYALVEETSYATPDHRQKVAQWGLPTNWLRNEIGVSDLSAAVIVKVEADLGKYEYGDRVVIDSSASARRVSPPGTFLYWDGIAASLAEITVRPEPNGGKLVAKVNTAHGAFETDPSKLVVLGRVKGVWKQAG
jgi:transcriptional regulator with XRE-family HTH domain